MGHRQLMQYGDDPHSATRQALQAAGVDRCLGVKGRADWCGHAWWEVRFIRLQSCIVRTCGGVPLSPAGCGVPFMGQRAVAEIYIAHGNPPPPPACRRGATKGSSCTLRPALSLYQCPLPKLSVGDPVSPARFHFCPPHCAAFRDVRFMDRCGAPVPVAAMAPRTLTRTRGSCPSQRHCW